MTLEQEYTKVPTKELLEDNPEKKPDPLVYGYGVRHVQSFIIFIIYSFAYLARAHLGVTVVAMTNEIEGENITVANGNETSPVNATVDSIWNIYRTYKWSKSIQEMVLSSFFLGYAIMTFASGVICQRWGGKIPLQIAMFINGIVSILSPWIVAWGGWKALSVCRILQGLSQGGMLPGIHTLLANWIPLSERGSLSSYVYTGSGIGTVMGFQLSGLLAYSRYGWPSTFWTVGVLCLLGFVLMSIFASATPDSHKSISEAEKNYIIGESGKGTHTQSYVPWKAIFTSLHVWSTVISHIGVAMSYIFIFIQVPTYMYAIMKLNIKNSGIFSSLPYISFVFCCAFFGYFSDILINKNIMTRKNVRRLANSIGTVVPSVCIIMVSYTQNVSLAVICFITALGAQSAIHSGWMINYIDLAPNYSGVLMAIGNGLGNLCVLIEPVLVSYIVKDVTNQIQWRTMMFLIASVAIISNIAFVIFLSADVQPWNERISTDPEDSKLKKEMEIIQTSS